MRVTLHTPHSVFWFKRIATNVTLNVDSNNIEHSEQESLSQNNSSGEAEPFYFIPMRIINGCTEWFDGLAHKAG